MGDDVRCEDGVAGEAAYREARRRNVLVNQCFGTWSRSFVATLVLWTLWSGTPVSAQDSDTSTTASPTFGGEFLGRSKLTGDWGGLRSRLALKGVTLDADVTQFYQGVTSGGLNRTFQYGGHGDYVMNVDGQKLVGLPGMFIKVRAEHRFGQNVNTRTGSILPAALAADLPTPDSDHVYLTNVLLMQFLSESFGVFAGKLDTLDGDLNAFAHGRGKDQFLNVALLTNPAGLLVAPYSTLGAGFLLVKNEVPWFTFTVLNAKETIKTAGFNELFQDGVVLAPEARLPTKFFGLTGHQLVGAVWSSREFTGLNQDPRVVLPNVETTKNQGSWSAYWNFDQYLIEDPQRPGRGWGVFARAGLADKETNPIHWFLSAGIGGNSPIPGREYDTFGVGWFYSKVSDETAQFAKAVLALTSVGQGVELFYNIGVTPWFHLTPDVQFIKPASERVDSAVVVGFRAKADF